MKTLEIFSGTKSFSKIAEKLGHETFTVDNNKDLNPDMILDLSNGIPSKLLKFIYAADIIWMSPPCTTFSMAAGNTHWNADRTPKTENAILGKRLLLLCEKIAAFCESEGKIYFIENPRARARWFLDPGPTRKTVWYCQYGHTNAKPTDIWTNLKNWSPKTCHNGNKDCHHQSAPRGSKTGTQGLKGAKERGVIPEDLFLEIFDYIDKIRK